MLEHISLKSVSTFPLRRILHQHYSFVQKEKVIVGKYLLPLIDISSNKANMPCTVLGVF